MYQRENLIVLMYARNNCYTVIVSPDDPLVEEAKTIIDADTGTFTAPNPSLRGDVHTYRIGNESRHFSNHSYRSGTIGVYDRTNLAHLNNMVHTAESATRSDRSEE